MRPSLRWKKKITLSITAGTVSCARMELLSGLRVVEGSAFVAAPLGGLTLAQLGADVIRFDTIGGGLDYQPLAGHRRRASACTGPG